MEGRDAFAATLSVTCLTVGLLTIAMLKLSAGGRGALSLLGSLTSETRTGA
jgi:hypothetical protein